MLRFILYANISILFIFHTKSARFLSTYLFQTGSIFIIILRSQVTKIYIRILISGGHQTFINDFRNFVLYLRRPFKIIYFYIRPIITALNGYIFDHAGMNQLEHDMFTRASDRLL